MFGWGVGERRGVELVGVGAAVIVLICDVVDGGRAVGVESPHAAANRLITARISQRIRRPRGVLQ